MSRKSLAGLMESLSLPGYLQEQLLNSQMLSVDTNGLVVTPPCDLLFSLNSGSEPLSYRLLSAFPETEAQVFFFPSNTWRRSSRTAACHPKPCLGSRSCLDRQGFRGVRRIAMPPAENTHLRGQVRLVKFSPGSKQCCSDCMSPRTPTSTP